jgi:putative heme-binding domain-containing protein
LIVRYRAVLDAPADATRGQAVFARECANCHRLGGAGHDVGPALVTVRARTPAEILEHILDPNREVSPHYLDYVVLQLDGNIQTGAIAAETPTSVTLRQPLGKQTTILRSEIETVTSSGKSLMPEGLDQKVTPDEMRDLIEFLRTATK